MNSGNIPGSEMRFDNVCRATERQSSCILCDWCFQSVHFRDPLTDNLIIVWACPSVYRAHLSRQSTWHTHFGSFYEEDRLLFEAEYPERKQGITCYKYNHTKIYKLTQNFRHWSQPGLFKKHSFLHYPCFNHHYP